MIVLPWMKNKVDSLSLVTFLTLPLIMKQLERIRYLHHDTKAVLALFLLAVYLTGDYVPFSSLTPSSLDLLLQNLEFLICKMTRLILKTS